MRTIMILALAAAVVGTAAFATGAAGKGKPLRDCAGQTPTIVGTNGPDTLTGTPGDDVIAAGAGKDSVTGEGGQRPRQQHAVRRPGR